MLCKTDGNWLEIYTLQCAPAQSKCWVYAGVCQFCFMLWNLWAQTRIFRLGRQNLHSLSGLIWIRSTSIWEVLQHAHSMRLKGRNNKTLQICARRETYGHVQRESVFLVTIAKLQRWYPCGLNWWKQCVCSVWAISIKGNKVGKWQFRAKRQHKMSQFIIKPNI